jgi:hypothetical protein
MENKQTTEANKMNYNIRTIELNNEFSVKYIYDQRDNTIYDSKDDLEKVYGVWYVKWLLDCNKFNVVVHKGNYYIEEGLWALTKMHVCLMDSTFAKEVNNSSFNSFNDRFNTLSMACLLDPTMIIKNGIDVFVEGYSEFKDSREFYCMEQLADIFGKDIPEYIARTNKWQVFYGDDNRRYLEDGLDACNLLCMFHNGY